MMDTKSLVDKLPFYAWDCVTLTLKNGEELFLVIKNETDMSMFLHLIVYKMQSLNGQGGSARPFIKKRVLDLC